MRLFRAGLLAAALSAAFSFGALAQDVSKGTIDAIATGTTGAVAATLAASTADKATWICGFDVSAIGGTAAIGPITVTGLLGGTFTYQFSSSATGVTLQERYSPCLPSSAQKTAIVVTTTADGTASAVDVQAWGFQQ
jgi:hypothetical protein